MINSFNLFVCSYLNFKLCNVVDLRYFLTVLFTDAPANSSSVAFEIVAGVYNFGVGTYFPYHDFLLHIYVISCTSLKFPGTVEEMRNCQKASVLAKVLGGLLAYVNKPNFFYTQSRNQGTKIPLKIFSASVK